MISSTIKLQSATNNKTQLFKLDGLFYALKSLLRNKLLLITVTVSCLLTLAIFICESFYVMLFKYLLLPASSVGFLFSVVGAGGVAGSLFSGLILNNLSKLFAISISSLIIGISILAVALYAAKWLMFDWVVFMSVSFIFGVSTSFYNVAFATFLQTVAPIKHIGSITSIVNGLHTIFMLMGPLLGSLFVTRAGLSSPFFVSGFMCLFIGFCILPFYKSYDYPKLKLLLEKKIT